MRDERAATEGHVATEPERERGARTNKLRPSRQWGMLGLPEIIGLAAALVLLLTAASAYLFILAPQRSRLRTKSSLQ